TNLAAETDKMQELYGSEDERLNAYFEMVKLTPELLIVYSSDSSSARATLRMGVELILSNIKEVESLQDEAESKNEDARREAQAADEARKDREENETARDTAMVEKSAILKETETLKEQIAKLQAKKTMEEEANNKLKGERTGLEADIKADKRYMDDMLTMKKKLEGDASMRLARQEKPQEEQSQPDGAQQEPKKQSGIMGLKIKCSECGKEWIYKGSKQRAMCPNTDCKYMNKTGLKPKKDE
ncbi:MAG: hypothetical protein ACRDF4_09535, partial [Rhabdochlamydiaceae bacterium]